MMAIFEPRGFSVLDVENLRLHYAETLRVEGLPSDKMNEIFLHAPACIQYRIERREKESKRRC